MYIILKTQVLFITYIINMSINNDNRKEKKLSSITTRRRIKTLYSHMTASSLNNNIADDGETEEPIIVNPLTATIGGEVDGSIDLSRVASFYNFSKWKCYWLSSSYYLCSRTLWRRTFKCSRIQRFFTPFSSF